MKKRTLEIIDENGNIHGPFASPEQADCYVDRLALGEQRDPDDERERGWYFRAQRT